MKKTKSIIAASAVLSLVLAGCASAPKELPKPSSASEIPDWVLNPTIEDGIASAQCVPWSGDMSLDRSEAIAEARADLVKQIEVKVKAMDKTYARRVTAKSGTSTGKVFEKVSKQVASRNLTATQVNKVDPGVKINEVVHLCAMVVFGREANKRLFEDLISSSGASENISPQDEDIMFEEFKAFKAQQELDKETQ
ncbi:MAG: hypothetical protein GY807_02990 [Gammaproteobacteria bacterium]|nr:hypothetical protein [Gammaproteobacteria bacterium]